MTSNRKSATLGNIGASLLGLAALAILILFLAPPGG